MSSSHPPSNPASAFLGGYELRRRLGVGGMAEVFEAHRSGPHGFRKRVALKRILAHAASDPAFVRMFIEEAALVAQLDHPNIVQVFDFGEEQGELFLTMELVEGTTVARVLRTLATKAQAVPLDIALNLVAQCARALAYAHGLTDHHGQPLELVHRDVSPGNLLLTRHGQLKLADFGIAQTQQRERHTGDRNLRGKIGYMSPEQVNGETLTAKSDVFTLGIVMAEMLMGETLFSQGADLEVLLRIRDVDLAALSRCRTTIPADVRGVLLSTLQRAPSERPEARALADQLETIMARRGLGAASAERVVQLLQRHELAPGDPSAGADVQPGARPTGLLELPEDSAQTVPSSPPPRITMRPGALQPERAKYIAAVPGERGTSEVAFPELVRLATTGVIEATSLIRKNRGAPIPACELPELSRVFETPALQWSREEIARPRMRGELNAARLLPLIHGLYARRETGMLHLADGARRKKIYFVEGRPDFVASTMRAEMLGGFLVDRGHCMSMEVDMGLAVMPQHNGRLGDALVNLGVLRPVQLYRAVSAQVRSRYLESFGWRRGEWLYVRSAESREDTYPIEQDAQVLMRDAAMQLHATEVEAALSPLWETVVRPAEEPAAPLSAYQVPDPWAWVISQARGDATVGALFARCCRQSHVDEEDAMRALYLGVSCELLAAA